MNIGTKISKSNKNCNLWSGVTSTTDTMYQFRFTKLSKIQSFDLEKGWYWLLYVCFIRWWAGLWSYWGCWRWSCYRRHFTGYIIELISTGNRPEMKSFSELIGSESGESNDPLIKRNTGWFWTRFTCLWTNRTPMGKEIEKSNHKWLCISSCSYGPNAKSYPTCIFSLERKRYSSRWRRNAFQ